MICNLRDLRVFATRYESRHLWEIVTHSYGDYRYTKEPGDPHKETCFELNHPKTRVYIWRMNMGTIATHLYCENRDSCIWFAGMICWTSTEVAAHFSDDTHRNQWRQAHKSVDIHSSRDCAGHPLNLWLIYMLQITDSPMRPGRCSEK